MTERTRNNLGTSIKIRWCTICGQLSICCFVYLQGGVIYLHLVSLNDRDAVRSIKIKILTLTREKNKNKNYPPLPLQKK